jgi:hypothetical protein
MAETFLGDLSQTKLFDLLKPLLTGRKSGMLMIKGSEVGEIFLEWGNIVHAKTDAAIGEEAFLKIMGWQNGKATFEPDVPPRGKTIFIPTENLLLNWSYKRQEWEKVRKLIPSSSSVFRLSLRAGSDEKNVKGDQWNALALANGARTLLEVAKTLGWDELSTTKVFYQLVEEGLLEKSEGGRSPGKKPIGSDFFKMLEDELKRIMGAVSSFLVDDLLSDFGETRESFPEDQGIPFVEALSKAIPHEQRKKEFRKKMMDTLPLKKER